MNHLDRKERLRFDLWKKDTARERHRKAAHSAFLRRKRAVECCECGCMTKRNLSFPVSNIVGGKDRIIGRSCARCMGVPMKSARKGGRK